MPHCHQWSETKEIPRSVVKKCAEFGLLAAACGHVPEEYIPYGLPAGIKPSEWDCFHEMICVDEIARCGSGGLLWGLQGGLSIGLPPVLLFGSKELQDKVTRPCLSGDKLICLGITEPSAGSDVAGLKTEAKDMGDHYLVNGEKKWITQGLEADFFTVACRTGGAGMGGVSLLLIERTMPGVTTRKMDCMGMFGSGTSYITFEDVKVPKSNLIGKENQGFLYVMHNFNHERLGIIFQATRLARVCVEESIKVSLRETRVRITLFFS
jgi:alkylation response protein AidB-like acyl-CoA dehydrogenase